MRKLAPSQRLREELRRFLRHMGGVEEGAGPLSEAIRPLHGLHKGARQ